MTLTHHAPVLYVAAAVAALGASGLGAAEIYPNRPVRMIVPFPSGSSADTFARIIGNKLSSQMGQQVIVDSRPGASGVIAIEIAKNALPDGYTLLLAGTTHFAALPALKAKLPYDPDRDFVALLRVASLAQVLAVHPLLGADTVADLVRLAKMRPGQLNYGSGGNGTTGHIAGEMFNVLAGVKTVHVPYKGSVLALNDLLAGQLQFIITSPVNAMPHWKTGRIKVIATAGAKPDPAFRDLPTVADTIPGFESTQWWGIAAPVKTPTLIVKKLHDETVKAVQSPEVRELIAKQGATARAESPAEFTAFMKVERERIGRIARHAGVTLD